jgi:hypothetical protein
MGTIQHHTAVVVVYDFAMERGGLAVAHRRPIPNARQRGMHLCVSAGRV